MEALLRREPGKKKIVLKRFVLYLCFLGKCCVMYVGG